MGLESYSYSPRNLLSSEVVSLNRYDYNLDGRGVRLGLTYLPWRGGGFSRLFAYDPGLHLIAETTMMTIPRIPPPWAYEYIWFAGVPVAQANSGGTTLWTMTDHLGTPFMQTLSDGSLAWRVEAEPYGWEYSLRSGTDRHQPLRFPGQEAEQLDLGINGSTERSYNIFRWYRAKWGRYSQQDPDTWTWWLHPQAYPYAWGSPTRRIDRLGLYSVTPSCQGAPFGPAITTAVQEVCNKTKPGTRCHGALMNISAAVFGDAGRIPHCFEDKCKGPQPVGCDHCITDCAASYPSWPPAIVIGQGSMSSCPASHGLGFGETLFHETYHLCVSSAEPYMNTPQGAWFRYAEQACFGWRDFGAPPRTGP